ncbi:hypothetical protein DYH09_01835 [bacterium CPR1]|nr:hypothetical protein [bacterium CPR1]
MAPPPPAPGADRRRAAWLLLGLAAALALPMVVFRLLSALRFESGPVDPPGLTVFRAQQCDHCHALDGISQATLGLSLDGIGQRASTRLPGVAGPDYLRRKILRPDTWRAPDSLKAMPAYEGKLSGAELDELVSWLMTR